MMIKRCSLTRIFVDKKGKAKVINSFCFLKTKILLFNQLRMISKNGNVKMNSSAIKVTKSLRSNFIMASERFSISTSTFR